jgi:hypothetical protein
MKENQQQTENFYIYVKEPLKPYQTNSPSFFDALELCKEDSLKEDETWRCISTNNHQTVELHFHSTEDKRIISITINLFTHHLDISSYAWHSPRKAYVKTASSDQLDIEIIEALLQRIFVKYKGRTAFLSLNKLKGPLKKLTHV